MPSGDARLCGRQGVAGTAADEAESSVTPVSRALGDGAAGFQRRSEFRAFSGEPGIIGSTGRRVSGHELLYCVSGSGYVVSGGDDFALEPFQLAWLSGFSAHGPDENTPWEVLWMRVEGHQMEQAWAALSVQERPVFEGLPQRETRKVFHRCERSADESSLDGGCGAELPHRTALGIFGRKQGSEEATWAGRTFSIDYPELRSALDQMAADPKRSWRAGELAKLCGLSERHFFRRFKQATGFSPINWLQTRAHQLRSSEAPGRAGAASSRSPIRSAITTSSSFRATSSAMTGSCPSEYRRARSSAANGRGAAADTYRIDEHGRILHAKGGILHSTRGARSAIVPERISPALLPLMCRPSHVGQFRNECFLPQRGRLRHRGEILMKQYELK